VVVLWITQFSVAVSADYCRVIIKPASCNMMPLKAAMIVFAAGHAARAIRSKVVQAPLLAPFGFKIVCHYNSPFK
jgi:hypothetical protein